MTEAEKLFNQIDEMAKGDEDEWDDDFIAPFPELVEEAKALIRQLEDTMPPGFSTTAGDGGVRVEWRNKVKLVSLVLSPTQRYIYYDDGPHYGLCETTDLNSLRQWLAWCGEV